MVVCGGANTQKHELQLTERSTCPFCMVDVTRDERGGRSTHKSAMCECVERTTIQRTDDEREKCDEVIIERLEGIRFSSRKQRTHKPST